MALLNNTVFSSIGSHHTSSSRPCARSTPSHLMGFSLRNPSAHHANQRRWASACTAVDATSHPLGYSATSDSFAPTSSNNGDSSSSQHVINNNTPPPSSALQNQFSALAAQVAEQQTLIALQQRQLHKLQNDSDVLAKMAQQQQSSSSKMASYSSNSSLLMAGSSAPSPFALQAQLMGGFGDRRLLGQYDSRFHSTNKSVCTCIIEIWTRPLDRNEI